MLSLYAFYRVFRRRKKFKDPRGAGRRKAGHEPLLVDVNKSHVDQRCVNAHCSYVGAELRGESIEGNAYVV